MEFSKCAISIALTFLILTNVLTCNGLVLYGSIVPIDMSFSNDTLSNMKLKIRLEDTVQSDSVLIRDFDINLDNGQKFPIAYSTDYLLKSGSDHFYNVMAKIYDASTGRSLYLTLEKQTILADVSQNFDIDIQKLSADTLDFCNLPQDAGMCRGYIPRFYYDPSTDQCKQFIYGGCGGNKNKHLTQSQCEFICSF
jgi:hypothetical protein